MYIDILLFLDNAVSMVKCPGPKGRRCIDVLIYFGAIM